MLSVIGELPSHGYRIGREIERRSSGYFRLTASTLYSALRRLEQDGLVQSAWHTASNTHRRCYWLTDKGREALNARLYEWNCFFLATERVMAGS